VKTRPAKDIKKPLFTHIFGGLEMYVYSDFFANKLFPIFMQLAFKFRPNCTLYAAGVAATSL